MEIVPKLNRDHVIRRYADASGVRQAREREQLGVELSEVEANITVLQAYDCLRTLTRRLTGSSVEGLMNIRNPAHPGEVTAGCALQISSITAQNGGAQVQILPTAMKKIGKA